MFDVFISYSRRDDADGWVSGLRDAIIADFQRFGRSPRIFFDREDIRDMDDWRQRILVGLRESRVLLVCLSPSYLASPYCRWEWTEYLRRQARQTGGDSIAGVYCVELGDPDAADVAQWKAEVESVQLTDVRPWFPHGRRALAEQVVREQVATLGERLWQRLEHARLSSDAPGNLTRFDPYFVGREAELQALRDSLTASRVGTVTVVSGFGGMGKTELATTYAHAYRHAYPGGTWQVGCENATSLTSVVASLTQVLGLEPPDGTPDDVRAHLVMDRLKELARTPPTDDHGKPLGVEPAALLLLDNVSEQALLSAEELRVLPEANWLHVVATTRLGRSDLSAVGSASLVDVVELGPLRPADAVEMIRDHQPPRDADGLRPDFIDPQAEAEAKELVEEVSSFTLAVKQAAVYLGANDDLRPADLLADLRRDGAARLDDVTVVQRRSVGAILDQTVAQLGPRSLAALRFAAHMPPDYVVWEWLEHLTHDLDQTHPGGERWPVVQRTLRGRQLLTPGDTPPLARLHRLIAAHVVDDLGDDAADYTNRLDAWAIERMTADDITDPDELRAFAELLIHRSPHSMDVAHKAVFYCDTFIGRLLLDQQHALVSALEEVFRRAVARDPSNTGWQHDLSVSLVKVGDIAKARGDLQTARDVYTESLDITRQLSTVDPSNTSSQHSLSISLHKVGDIAVAQGDLQTAQDLYTESLDIARALTTVDPSNTDWRRNLTVSLDRVGDIAEVRGDLQAAQDLYTESLDIRRALTTADPSNTSWQHGLSFSLDRVGNIAKARGDLQATQDLYTESLDIRRALAAADPGNTGWRRDLTVSLDRVGDVARARGDLEAALEVYAESLDITRALTTVDPSNTGWQHDLAVSLVKVGDIAKAHGDLQTARDVYIESLDITRQLTAHDPGNTDWRRDLAVSLERVGDIAKAHGDLQTARDVYTESLDIRRALTAHDPGNTDWRRNLSVGCYGVWQVTQKTELLREARDILRDLVECGAAPEADKKTLDWMNNQLGDPSA
ncbi:MAG: toll/interleukin-1 receptor domain-containing protein [Aeromicrobium sp.]|uniref:tetratricopeptide repeat protein n=1 Tax=Aeromicrobium sp. TaxID=1871063 RepID=UPI0039E5FBAF